jgi:hypothetical protein
MHKRRLRYLAFGILVTAMTACRPLNDNNNPTTLEAEPGVTPSVAIARQATDPSMTAIPTVGSTISPPLAPTPVPTEDNWQTIGGEPVGILLSVPGEWVDLSAQLDTPTAVNQLGLVVLLAGDTDRTGRTLLAGKGIESGAYVQAIHTSAGSAATSIAEPTVALESLLAGLQPPLQALGPATPVTSANGIAGAMVEVTGNPVGATGVSGQNVRTRILLFIPPAQQPPQSEAPIVVLLGAATNEWEPFAEIFTRIAGSITIFSSANAAPGLAGPNAALGELAEEGRVAGTLRQGTNDLWTFPTSGNRYVTLGLRPDDPHLDLTLTIFGPSGETIAQIDNGFAGDSEVATDLFLPEAGLYVAEVSDFFQETGRYTLSIAQADQQRYSGGGRIEFGQAIQGELLPDNQHIWTFDGAAGQSVSIVVEPIGDGFDTILNVYGPDGQRLVALDEGFSGDPEVVVGFELPLSGLYSIIVSSFSGQGGGYTVSLDESQPGIANFFDAGDLVYGDLKQQSLRPREAQAWFFQARAGEQIVIETRPLSSHLDLDVWLMNPAIERIAVADKFLAGEAERIEFNMTQDGQYIVLVQDYNGQAGDYEISLQTVAIATPESAGALSFGDSVTGVVHPGSASAWTFDAQQGDVMDIAVQPVDARSDLIIALLGPDGLAVVEVDENAAGGAESMTAFSIPLSGRWQIVISEFFDEGGGYELSLQRAQ